MKNIKKILAGVCSLAMLASMFVGMTSASAADALVTISTAQTDKLADDNSLTIDFDTTVATMTSGAAWVSVPEALKAYIASWEWSTGIANNSITTGTSGTYVTGSQSGKSYISASFSTGTTGEQATNGKMASLKIKFVEGGVPKDALAEADRTIAIGGEFKGTKKQATAIATGGVTKYAYVAADSAKAPATYWAADLTAAGNYVVVPETEPSGKIPTATTATPVYDGTAWPATAATATAIADSEGNYTFEGVSADDTAVAYGVGLKGDGNAHTKLIWKVAAKGETKGHETALNFGGTGTAKVGLAIQGLTAADVESVSVAFGD